MTAMMRCIKINNESLMLNTGISNSQFGLIGVEMSKNYNFNQHDCSRLQIFCNVKKTIMRIAVLEWFYHYVTIWNYNI